MFALTLWKFSRPHTIIGSALSIAALYVLATGLLPQYWQPELWWALTAALLCNVFITGYNQVVDVDLDRINKPYLPIASGAMGMGTAKVVCAVALAGALGAAALQGPFLLALIAAIALLGFVYSHKAIYLKRHHTTAAMAITLVRGVMVNVGFYIHFAEAGETLPPALWTLVVFTSLFSLGIAWFKDIPDTPGDATAGIGSLALRLGVDRAWSAGVYTVCSGYVAGAFAALLFHFEGVNGPLLCVGHAVLGIMFLSVAQRVRLNDLAALKRFYRYFWLFFFAEYLLFAAAVFF